MKFVVDAYIPFIETVLEPYGEVVYATPAEITPELVRDADALLVRTRTRVNADLLSGSRCTFVGTATIGMDHFDMAWCREHGITAVNAPGCNAPAVAQYVFASIVSLIPDEIIGKKIAIVGVGHVGGLVEKWARGLGMEVLRVDPPRQRVEGGDDWYTLEEAAKKADIITFHTPLDREGEDATYHLADKDFFAGLKNKPIIINSSRGPIVDNDAWLKAIEDGNVSQSVVDVWEGEPMVSKELMMRADIATPHIAGYSLDGKIRATGMVLDSLSRHFGLPKLSPVSRCPVEVPDRVTIEQVKASDFNPAAETERMRAHLLPIEDATAIKEEFERLRDFYGLRNEIS